MKKSRVAIIMLGPPGAGKGTQARVVSQALRLPQVSTGDMLREAIKNKTELGKKAEAFMVSGALVPDALVDAIVAERLQRKDCRNGLILDGYPRTIPQAECLHRLFDKDGTKILALGVVVRHDELIKRLSSRWTCPDCGKMFNSDLDPGIAGGRCDACGTELVQREDDRAEVIAERLQVYSRKTAPLIQYYQEQSCYFEIDGDKPVHDVSDAIMEIVKGD
jgi:adenylate kinase